MTEQSDEIVAWHWYCRICGEAGDSASEATRDADAVEHVRAKYQRPEPQIIAVARAGRLVHVWPLPVALSQDMPQGYEVWPWPDTADREI